MVGFHFPPSADSSGHLRMLGFARYLPESGWSPVVLSATGGAYERVDPMSVQSIPDACPVHRAWALDAKRHMGLGGRYPSVFAQPDRWASWWPAAVALGLRMVRRYRPDAIWSTYPIMTAHRIAYTLSRMTGIPWVADFRDPVGNSVIGKNPMTVESQTRWEGRVMSRAACSVFTTQGASQLCAQRYPDTCDESHRMVIANGYDETAFTNLPDAPTALVDRPLVLVHSGSLYASGRNPAPFFTALARLKDSGGVCADDLRVVLRASGSEAAYTRDIQRLGIDGMVNLAGSVSNHEAVREQAEADALLLFQGAEHDLQIPAKLYEYLRIGRPIFALVGERGDTAALLRGVGGAELVPLDDAAVIETRLLAFIRALRAGAIPRVDPSTISRYSRREGAAQLARLLDRVTRPGTQSARR